MQNFYLKLAWKKFHRFLLDLSQQLENGWLTSEERLAYENLSAYATSTPFGGPSPWLG